jgi:hypothetical protein
MAGAVLVLARLARPLFQKRPRVAARGVARETVAESTR